MEDGDSDLAALIDMGAFEFVSTTIPLCSFDGDEDCDLDDADALIAEIAAATHRAAFDLTGDGLVNLSDRDQWLALAGALNLPSGNPYLLGDANLDGAVDGADFIIWNQNKFANVAAWSSGDFNADGGVDGADFILWNINKFRSADSSSRSATRDRTADPRLGA